MLSYSCPLHKFPSIAPGQIVSAAYETQFTFGSRLKGAKPFVNYLDCVEKVVKQNVSKWSSNKEIQHFILSGSLPRYSAALSTLHKCVSSRAVARYKQCRRFLRIFLQKKNLCSHMFDIRINFVCSFAAAMINVLGNLLSFIPPF